MTMLTCPACATRLDQGSEFMVIEPYKTAMTSTVAYMGEDGSLIVDPVDRGEPERIFAPQIECQSCGHQWTTSRNIVRQ